MPASIPRADALSTRTPVPLETLSGQPFPDHVLVAATFKGEPVAGAAVTIRLYAVDSDKQLTLVKDSGPYIRDETEATREFPLLRTDAAGTVKLPQLFADSNVGSYMIRVITDGAVLDIDLLVRASGAAPPTVSSSGPSDGH